MRVVITLDISPTDDVADDAEARGEFVEALKDDLETQFSADPTALYETGDSGEFSYEITHSEVKFD